MSTISLARKQRVLLALKMIFPHCDIAKEGKSPEQAQLLYNHLEHYFKLYNYTSL